MNEAYVAACQKLALERPVYREGDWVAGHGIGPIILGTAAYPDLPLVDWKWIPRLDQLLQMLRELGVNAVAIGEHWAQEVGPYTGRVFDGETPEEAVLSLYLDARARKPWDDHGIGR